MRELWQKQLRPLKSLVETEISRFFKVFFGQVIQLSAVMYVPQVFVSSSKACLKVSS
jgi:hypothetical protein